MTDEEFRIEIEKLLVSEKFFGRYPWLNNATAAAIMIEELKSRIEKHPFIWKLLFRLT